MHQNVAPKWCGMTASGMSALVNGPNMPLDCPLIEEAYHVRPQTHR